MKLQEYLLVKLMEECAEVNKCVSKMLIFGIDNQSPFKDQTNLEELHSEVNDILAILEMLAGSGICLYRDDDKVSAKIYKVKHYMQESKRLGILEDEPMC